VYLPALFGCREFPAYFELVDIGAPPPRGKPFDLDIGLMLYDIFDLGKPGVAITRADDVCISLFRASVSSGTLVVPGYCSADVIKVRRGAQMLELLARRAADAEPGFATKQVRWAWFSTDKALSSM